MRKRDNAAPIQALTFWEERAANNKRDVITKKPIRCLVASLASIFLAAIYACDQGDPGIPLADGLNEFNKVVESSYKKLVVGRFRKKAGFSTKCSVDIDTVRGIRVSETICDDDENSLDVTIRITDPTSRPPSQQQKTIRVTQNDGGSFAVDRGDTKTLAEGITFDFDRSGQSAVINGKVDSGR